MAGQPCCSASLTLRKQQEQLPDRKTSKMADPGWSQLFLEVSNFFFGIFHRRRDKFGKNKLETFLLLRNILNKKQLCIQGEAKHGLYLVRRLPLNIGGDSPMWLARLAPIGMTEVARAICTPFPRKERKKKKLYLGHIFKCPRGVNSHSFDLNHAPSYFYLLAISIGGATDGAMLNAVQLEHKPRQMKKIDISEGVDSEFWSKLSSWKGKSVRHLFWLSISFVAKQLNSFERVSFVNLPWKKYSTFYDFLPKQDKERQFNDVIIQQIAASTAGSLCKLQKKNQQQQTNKKQPHLELHCFRLFRFLDLFWCLCVSEISK